MALGALCTLAVSGCELGTVSLFGVITDRVLAKGNLAEFWGLAAWWLAIVAVAAAAMFVAEYITSLASERFALRLRDEVFGRAQRLPPDFFDRRRLGDLRGQARGQARGPAVGPGRLRSRSTPWARSRA